MEIRHFKALRTAVLATFSILFWASGLGRAFAEIEIDLDEATKPTPVPVAKPTPPPATAPTNNMPAPTPTAVPVAPPAQEVQPTPTPQEEMNVEQGEEKEQEQEEKPQVIHGVFKMKNYYDAGIKAYKAKEYDRAIRYLRQAVKTKDKRTPKFYYAEAYATLGLIYQFHIIHYDKAYAYYKAALVYEKRNHTARKYIGVVKRHLKGNDD